MAVREKKVVLAGAGTMGASLAQVYAQAGWETVLWNRSASGLDRARALIALNQESFVREGLLTQEASDALLARIRMTTERDDFSDAALVVENIVEKLDAKRAFFAEISPLVPEEALLATNTSGLRISEIAEACRGPERFMGQHWLNPPHLLPLCEIIAGERTDPENVRKMRALVEGLGKRPVVVADISGFLINRLQFALLREALHIVDTGAATVEDVDTALKAGMGLRYAALGPFGVADFGGLDTFDHINSYLNAQLDDSKTGSRRLHEMVEAGKLGVKSGRGFYDYSGDRAAEAIRERDRLYIELAKDLYFKKPSEAAQPPPLRRDRPDGQRPPELPAASRISPPRELFAELTKIRLDFRPPAQNGETAKISVVLPRERLYNFYIRHSPAGQGVLAAATAQHKEWNEHELFCTKHPQRLSAGPQRKRQDRPGREPAVYDRRHRPHGPVRRRQYRL